MNHEITRITPVVSSSYLLGLFDDADADVDVDANVPPLPAAAAPLLEDEDAAE